MNVDTPGSCMFGIESLYPGYGDEPEVVADTMVSIIIDTSN